MKTLFQAPCREEIHRRLAALSATSTRQWGTMTVPEALSHLGDQLALALGFLEVEGAERERTLNKKKKTNKQKYLYYY